LTFSLPAYAGKSNPDTGEKCWGRDCIDPEDRPDLPEAVDSPGPAPTSTSAGLSEACEIVAQRVYDLCLASPDANASVCNQEYDEAYENCVGGPDGDPPDDGEASTDERVVVQNPARVPFYTIAKVDLGPAGGGRGSAVLVGPCTLLTNAHVVYNRKKDQFRAVSLVHPGSYYDEGRNQSVDPYGSKADSKRATNTKWVDTGDDDYDYGAIFVSSPFPEITTFMTVVFEQEPSFINVAGYPSEGLPSNGRGSAQEQWRGSGAINKYDSRLMYYEATSSGGGSGSPVWAFYPSTGERRLVGVNRAHSKTYNGIGTRFVSQNENLITGWLREPCSDAARRSAARIDFATLLRERRTLTGDPIVVRQPDAFGLVPAPQSLEGLVPARRVAQWIEGQFYRWEEFSPAGPNALETADRGGALGPVRGRPPQRFIRLLEPERRVLSREAAAVLLSASMLWQREPAAPTQPVYYEPPAAVQAVEVEAAPPRPGPARPEAEITDRD
jgi:V8-like Glu-specific endopeptidase